ncbi:MAG: polysaccharide deacetylase family protein [Bacteroidia bacterium]|nr:polysaccharide deacetylase family protein [Bacteroidia bacterium]
MNAPVQEQLQHEKLNCGKYIYLNTKDIEELKTNTNTTFGNHTYTHYDLNAVPLYTAITDVTKNENYLNETLKITSKHLAIPFGKQEHFNNEIIESLGSNNYTSALTTNPNAINLTALNSNKYKQSGVHILPRIGLTNESVNDLLFLINRTIFKNYEI